MKSIRSNPFVVLADITIALCFIFAVYAVSSTALNSQLIVFFDRDARQEKLSKTFEKKLEAWLTDRGYTYTRSVNKFQNGVTQVAYSGQRPFGGEKDRPLLGIWRNASFQRISVYEPVFGNSAELPDLGKDLYTGLGQILVQNRQEISYVFLHGITQPQEIDQQAGRARGKELLGVRATVISDLSRSLGVSTTGMGRGETVAAIVAREQVDWARKMSVARATKVFALLQAKGFVSRFGDESPGTSIPAKYVIPFGTGKELYLDEVAPIGRVDVLLFFGDVKQAVDVPVKP